MPPRPKSSLPGTIFLLALCVPATARGQQAVPNGPEFQVNTLTTDAQSLPSVAMDASGDFIVVWQSFSQDGFSTAVIGQRYAASGPPIGGEFQVNTYTTDSQQFARIGMDASGDFVVAWQSFGQDGDLSGVFGQRFDSTAAPALGEFQVSTHTTDFQTFPDVAMDPSGDFVVVWHSQGQDGSSYGVFGQRFDSAGAPQGGEFQVNTYTNSAQYFPGVAMDGTGNFVVVWHSFQDGSSSGIFGQRFDGGGMPQGDEFRVNTFTPSAQQHPDAAMDAAGAFVVVWQGGIADGSSTGIFGQRFDTGGMPQGVEFQVNTHTLNAQAKPAVAMDPTGMFVVTWQSDSQDGSGYGVFGQAFDSGGMTTGSEFQVNSYTSGDQKNPDISMDGSGNFVVTWESFAQDRANDGIFGQRFCLLIGCGPDVTAPATEILGVSVTGVDPTTIGFESQDAVAGASTVYDVVTGLLSDLLAARDYSGAACLGTVDDTPAIDSMAAPAPGDGRYYLVRARVDCEVACGAGYGDSTLVPDPRDDLDISGPCP